MRFLCAIVAAIVLLFAVNAYAGCPGGQCRERPRVSVDVSPGSVSVDVGRRISIDVRRHPVVRRWRPFVRVRIGRR